LREANMPRPSLPFTSIAAAAALLAAVAYAPRALRAQQASTVPAHPAPAAKDGGVVVMLCDGKTSVEVKGVAPGHEMSREQALAVTRKLMAKWQQEHPGEKWQMAQAERPAASAAHAPRGHAAARTAGATQQGDTYASFTDRDYKVWKAQTDAFVAEGKRIFHDSKALGGTIGVSCDMCHPDAANTHPETYPKYQVQLQRVALLRDMIDWCIENPVKGKALAPDDPKLRALEAYILAQRKGVPLDYGKH
jgi:thiosulfate dehydrogenase